MISFPTSTGAADTLATIDEEHPTNRFNDAKCDHLGRLWGGTMGYEDKPWDRYTLMMEVHTLVYPQQYAPNSEVHSVCALFRVAQ